MATARQLGELIGRDQLPRRKGALQAGGHPFDPRWLGLPFRHAASREWVGDLRKADPTTMCYILCVMERVGVRELRQNLSVYLRRVKAGQRLEVTERGQTVARLEPVGPDDALTRLERQGRVVRRATGDLSKIRPLKLSLERSMSSILEELGEDRV